MKLSLATCIGSMKILLDSGVMDCVTAIGCTESDWRTLVGPKPWVGVDRSRVSRVLEGLLFGMVDIMGLPRFDLPAEFAAAVVALFVHPVNYFPACVWVGEFEMGDALSGFSSQERPATGFERAHPRQVFALVITVSNGADIEHLARSFASKSDTALGYVVKSLTKKEK